MSLLRRILGQSRRALWYEIWSAWLLLLVGSFGLLEGIAIATGGVTLSRFTFDLSLAWPLFVAKDRQLTWIIVTIRKGLEAFFVDHAILVLECLVIRYRFYERLLLI